MQETGRKFDTKPVSFQRVGEKSFIVEHDDGSTFKGEANHFPSELAGSKRVKGLSRRTKFSAGFGKGKLTGKAGKYSFDKKTNKWIRK